MSQKKGFTFADLNLEKEIDDEDRDSLHTLPLVMLPIQTAPLRRARLIKNARFESMVEIFTDKDTGSGQVAIDHLPAEFGWTEGFRHPDMIMMKKLGDLPSYDVYSLRISLRDLGIEVNNVEYLKLSDAKAAELTEYMREFTGPLISQIYGGDDVEVKSFQDVVKLFRSPDRKKALEKLKLMAQKLNIKIEDLPKFIEDYADIFMSLSYYKQILDDIEPTITEFLDTMDLLRQNFAMKNNQSLMQTMDMMTTTINELMAAITGRFENFDRGTKHMWDNISAERFRRVEAVIRGYHTTIGGVLCALSVKMDAWSNLFPNMEVGGPGRRAEFIMTEMKQGMDRIQMIEDSAPMLAALE